MRLNFLILGAQKSASTFLQFCLAQHPDVFIHKQEMPIFEDPDYAHFSEAFIDGLFAGRSERRLGIKRPAYIGRPEVPERIYRAVPEAKLIAVLRNPVARALSGYFYYMAGSYIPLLDAETGMRNLLAGRYAETYPRAQEILEFGLYHKYVSMYGPYLDSGRMFLIKQEDLVAEPAESFRRVFQFLDVDPGFRPATQKAKRQGGHYNLLSQRVMRFAGTISYKKNESNTRAFERNNSILRLVGKTVLASSNFISGRFLKNTKPTLSKSCTDALYGYYADDVRHLESLTGWNLSSWKSEVTIDRATAGA